MYRAIKLKSESQKAYGQQDENLKGSRDSLYKGVQHLKDLSLFMRPGMQNKPIPMSTSNYFSRGQYNKVTLGYLGKICQVTRDG